MDTEKVISALIDDDVENLIQLLSNINDYKFQIPNYKLPKLLKQSQGEPIISIACYFGSFECYKYLSDSEIDCSNFRNHPFIYACAGGNMNIVRDISIKFDLQIDTLNEIGRNYFFFTNYERPGYVAIEYGHLDVVKWLFLKGYKFHRNEILKAFSMGYEDIAEFFINNIDSFSEYKIYDDMIDCICLEATKKSFIFY